jgi:hypothetical protein
MIALAGSTFHRQIIDWTALTDKANGNALKDANAYVVESS